MGIAANVNIKNKRASFEYHLLDRYVAGIGLLGTEIKSIREGKANINDNFCYPVMMYCPGVIPSRCLNRRTK